MPGLVQDISWIHVLAWIAMIRGFAGISGSTGSSRGAGLVRCIVFERMWKMLFFPATQSAPTFCKSFIFCIQAKLMRTDCQRNNWKSSPKVQTDFQLTIYPRGGSGQRKLSLLKLFCQQCAQNWVKKQTRKKLVRQDWPINGARKREERWLVRRKKGDRPPFDSSYYFESTNILKLEFLFLEPFVLLCLWNRRGSGNMMNITVYSQSCFPPNFHPNPWHVVLNVWNCTSIFFLFWEGGGGYFKSQVMYTGLPKCSPRGQSWSGQWPLLLLNISNMRVGLAYMTCQSTDSSLLQEPKIHTLYVLLGQRGRNCVRCPWCQGLLGGRPICSGRPAGPFRFPCHPRWATEPKIEASPINEDASLSAYLPRCMGDTSTQYATVINKKLVNFVIWAQ